jgi:hypothetical protein
MTTTPRKAVPHAVYDGLVDWEGWFAMAHINNGAWPRESASYRIVTVGESREPVTSMAASELLPEAKN